MFYMQHIIDDIIDDLNERNGLFIHLQPFIFFIKILWILIHKITKVLRNNFE